MNSTAHVFGRSALFLFLLGVAFGCENVRPIYQVESRPIPEAAKTLTLKQMEARILKAARLRNWRVRAIEPGRMRGHLDIKGRPAVVSIIYDQQFFSIRYVSSERLYAGTAWPQQAYAGEFVIHRRYNSHVRRLERAIDQELSFPEL